MTIAYLNSPLAWDIAKQTVPGPPFPPPPALASRLSSRTFSRPSPTKAALDARQAKASLARALHKPAGHYSRAIERSKMLAERRAARDHSRRVNMERRHQRVQSRKQLLQTERVCRLAMHNDHVAIRRAMHAASNEMMSQHQTERTMVLQALAMSLRLDRQTQTAAVNGRRLRERRERIIQAREEKTRMRQERAAEESRRVQAAATRRHDHIRGVVEKAGRMRGSPTSSPTAAGAAASAATTPPSPPTDRFSDAIARREILIAQRSEQAGLHNATVMEIANTPPKPSLTPEDLFNKANGAAARREDILTLRVLSAKKHNESVERVTKRQPYDDCDGDFSVVKKLHTSDEPLPVFGI